MAEQALDAAPRAAKSSTALVIGGASLGTMFEWYDFFLYGALASDIARRFFAGVGDNFAFVLALIAFGAGFAVRPLGAVVFGRIGDIVGRKNTFMVTMALMGASTFAVGILPDYGVIGILAPILLVALRLLQGLAIGGEYGGASIYVAEHAPPDRRGLHTSWINAMSMLGLVLSLIVISVCRLTFSAADFAAWGWRVPFLLSVVLLGISLWVRVQLSESPVFQRMKDAGETSKAPMADSFGTWSNVRTGLIVIFGLVAGGTTIWYSAHFYSLFFLERILKVDSLTADAAVAIALAIAAPSYLLVGWVSDKIGRKPVLMAGCALGALFLFPLFNLLTEVANPALAAAQRSSPVIVYSDPTQCSVQFDPTNAGHFTSRACDVAKAFLTRAGVSYNNVHAPAGSAVNVHVGATVVTAPDVRTMNDAQRTAAIAAFQTQMRASLDSAGYPASADPARVNVVGVIAIIIALALIAACVFAPTAAFLVELFPARVRYTSFSVPYHLGVGWIGGFLPATAFAITAASGDIYAGLWYPVGFATISLVLGTLLLPETRGREI